MGPDDAPTMPPPPARSNRPTWFALIALAIIMSVLAATRRPALDTPRMSPPWPPSRADYAWKLENPDGTPFDFGTLKGRAVFLNIWATWCPPCRAELPAIASLAANPRLKDVAFLCVSTDEDASTLRRFIAAERLKLPMARASTIPEAFASEAIPATYIIAPDGAIVVARIGAAKWDDPAVLDLLEKLAKRKP